MKNAAIALETVEKQPQLVEEGGPGIVRCSARHVDKGQGNRQCGGILAGWRDPSVLKLTLRYHPKD